ncbi:hypothetical protein [Lentibacillus saliphilus]|uniref:hypothetical protein n=1 Tax=Lentibacillus saliphilus TaxID=2737028 RepID=UPI001C304ED2|nr:hypothetical protein [Lentibacillus saliphilus]
MEPIAVQTYYQVERQVDRTGQSLRKDAHYLYLYQTIVSSTSHIFNISDVHDMSFRKVGKQGGLLYLHTISGVHAYPVHASPHAFMTAFHRQLKHVSGLDF